MPLIVAHWLAAPSAVFPDRVFVPVYRQVCVVGALALRCRKVRGGKVYGILLSSREMFGLTWGTNSVDLGGEVRGKTKLLR